MVQSQRCPHCGCAVIGHVADHIAFSSWCTSEQLALSAGMDASQRLSEDPE